MAGDVDSTPEYKVRRALTAERPAALDALEALAAQLAHEIRNPLNCALLQLAVLRRRLEAPGCSPPTVLAVAALVERSLRRLEALVNDSLAGVQARAGIHSPVPVGERMPELVVTVLNAQASSDGLTVSLHIAGTERLEPEVGDRAASRET
jgi:signal transduction histidine kinase